MTEEEWNACADPQRMLELLRTKGSSRKWRLAAVACCRSIWSMLPDEESRAAVELSELYADGLVTGEQMAAVQSRITPRSQRHYFNPHRSRLGDAASEFVRTLARPTMRAKTVNRNARWVILSAWRFSDALRSMIANKQALDLTAEKCCRVLRCIFEPFHPVTLNPAWLTPTVKQLAEAIYVEKAFDRMPILGDGLEEAGCDNTEILEHFRKPGEHVRGCWVVDLILGKE